MIRYCFDDLHIKDLWVVGWSFGTSIAISHARDPRVKGLILLSPTLLDIVPGDLEFGQQMEDQLLHLFQNMMTISSPIRLQRDLL